MGIPTLTAWSDDDPIMISALEHFSYCPRQCALIHQEQTFDENLYTLRGRAVHEQVDEKEVIVVYQKRKQEEIQHPIIERKVPIGLIPHVQARLLARVLRGDMEDYLPFLYR